jgi:hypothetical protein
VLVVAVLDLPVDVIDLSLPIVHHPTVTADITMKDVLTMMIVIAAIAMLILVATIMITGTVTTAEEVVTVTMTDIMTVMTVMITEIVMTVTMIEEAVEDILPSRLDKEDPWIEETNKNVKLLPPFTLVTCLMTLLNAM